jgi:hypothetical protein
METAVPTPTTRRPGGWRIASATTLGLIALALLAAGIAGIWARAAHSDHGYIASGAHPYTTDGRAIVSDTMDVSDLPGWLVGKIWIDASSTGGKPLFVGVARRADVDRYLAGVSRSIVDDVHFGPFGVDYVRTPGKAAPGRPGDRTFWAASSVGAHPSVAWKIRDGNWRVVVMNADGSPRVSTDAKVGGSIRGDVWIVAGGLALGVVLAAGAVALLVGGSRRR